MTGQIAGIDFLGSVLRMKVNAGGAAIAFDTFNDPTSPPPKFGETVSMSFDRESLLVLGE